MNPLIRQQLDLNETTRDDWESFAGHRQRVTELLLNSADGHGRLCVLGAGNCNDIHLLDLVRTFEQVCLVDLDGGAMSRRMASEPLSVGDRLSFMEDDVSGALSRIATWSPATRLEPGDLEVLAAGAQLGEWSFSPRSFDVVASTCLLSQLVGSLTQALTDRHPQFLDAVKAIRTGHFRTIASLLRPRGRAVLISDIVSSDTCPELLTASDRDTSRLVTSAINAGNFFTGLNPAVILGLLKSDSVLASLFQDATFIPYWIWHCGPRAYAVYAIQATLAA